jgi:hypothetical protein
VVKAGHERDDVEALLGGGEVLEVGEFDGGVGELNKAIHRIAITQIAHGGPGKQYFQRRIAEGDTRHRALRSLKRRLARVVFTRLHAHHRDAAAYHSVVLTPRRPGEVPDSST